MATLEAPELTRSSQEGLADRLLAGLASLRRNARRRAVAPAEFAALTGAQLELVRLVRRRPGISVADAARELRLASNTVSTLVGQLTHARLVAREIDPADRRIARLALTAEMGVKVAAWRDRRTVALGEAIARLAPEERRCLAAALPVLERLADELGEGFAR